MAGLRGAEEFMKFVRDETAKWDKVIKISGAQVE